MITYNICPQKSSYLSTPWLHSMTIYSRSTDFLSASWCWKTISCLRKLLVLLYFDQKRENKCRASLAGDQHRCMRRQLTSLASVLKWCRSWIGKQNNEKNREKIEWNHKFLGIFECVQSNFQHSDASTHLYIRVCPSVRPSGRIVFYTFFAKSL